MLDLADDGATNCVFYSLHLKCLADSLYGSGPHLFIVSIQLNLNSTGHLVAFGFTLDWLHLETIDQLQAEPFVTLAVDTAIAPETHGLNRPEHDAQASHRSSTPIPAREQCSRFAT